LTGDKDFLLCGVEEATTVLLASPSGTVDCCCLRDQRRCRDDCSGLLPIPCCPGEHWTQGKPYPGSRGHQLRTHREHLQRSPRGLQVHVGYAWAHPSWHTWAHPSWHTWTHSSGHACAHLILLDGGRLSLDDSLLPEASVMAWRYSVTVWVSVLYDVSWVVHFTH